MKNLIIVVALIIFISILPSPPLHPEDDAASLYRQGMEQYEKKNYKSAYDLFRRVLLINPFNEEASNMYWKMKSQLQNKEQADKDNETFKDSDIEPLREKYGKKVNGEGLIKKKETRHREARAEREREAAAALRELRNKIANLNNRIDTREQEFALIEKQHKQKWQSERDNSRRIFLVSASILIVLLAVSTGMLIYAFIIISRRDKGTPVALLPENAAAGGYIATRSQLGGVQQVPHPLQGRQEAWDAAANGIIPKPAREAIASASAEYFSKMEITIAGFVRLIEHRLKRDNNDFRVRKLCHDIGMKLGLTSVEMTELRTAALMKDIGFLLIPESLLLKEKALTKPERDKVQKHVAHSLRIAQYTPQPPRILEAVEKHHERMDGSGYPYGIKGERIPLFSRIIGACDTFTALTSDRPYRAALDNETALSVMKKESRLFDPEILALLFEIFGQEVVRSQQPGDYLSDRELYPDETLAPRK